MAALLDHKPADTPTNTITVTDTTPITNTNTITDTTPITNTNATTSTKTDDSPPPAKDDGACSIGRSSAAKRVAPWLLAGTFSLLFVFARRRKQS